MPKRVSIGDEVNRTQLKDAITAATAIARQPQRALRPEFGFQSLWGHQDMNCQIAELRAFFIHRD